MSIEKIETAFDAVDNKIDHGMHLIDTGLDAFFHGLNTGVKKSFKMANTLMDALFDTLERNGKLIRYAGLPWSIAIPKLWSIAFKRRARLAPIFQPGIHMIRAKVGGGKPRLSEDGKYWYVMHQVIDLRKYYKNGKKVLQFNTDKRKRINKDERHLQYPPRMNKTKEYNESFNIEHEDHLLMRHDGMDWIGMYSQHMKLDSLDMDSITYMHEVSTVKSLPVMRWLNDGLLRIFPTKLKIESYTVDTDFKGQMDRRLIKKHSIKIKYDVLQRYDTHAEARKHAGIKKDY